MMRAVRTIVVALLAINASHAPLRAQGSGTAKIYVGTYAKQVLVMDEATMRVTDTIPVSIGVPVGITVSADRSRMYVMDPNFEKVEVFDLATRKAVDQFTLSEGDKRVRLSGGFNVDPQQRFAIVLAKTYTKKIDRFEIGPPKLLRYDLAKRQVTDTIPWPRDEERDFARILFSPSGHLMYFFTTDEILIYDAVTLKQVDRWDLAQPLEEGMGRFNFGFPADVFEVPGWYMGVFRQTDPVQNRTLMGVARVNLEQRTVDFYTIGPSGPASFVMSPDRRRAYGLRQEVGNWEFWTYDLEGRRVASRTVFEGRPRMQLTPSSNGRYLYLHGAGSTIDVRDPQTFRVIRTVQLPGDMTGFRLVPPLPSSGR
jgi:DNA-binding beta-propeller fold protein YncE